MINDTLDYDRTKAARLLSAMHKHVRRTRPIEAMLAAYRLAEMSEPNAWAELRVIAIEDVAQPLEMDTIERLNQWRREQLGREKFGRRCMGLMAGMKILAEAQSDRRADELLNLISNSAKSLPAKHILEQYESKLFPDEVDDGHTVQGRRKGRGFDFFVKVSSKCTNMVPAYETWRALWEEVMTGEGSK